MLRGAHARAGVPKMLLLLTDGTQTVDGDDATAIAQALPKNPKLKTLS